MASGRSALCAALLALATAAPLTAQALQGSPPVQVVRFVGNRTFDGPTLAAAIATNSGQCKVLALLCMIGIGKEPYYFDEPTLRADVIRLRLFYYEQGFREAKVTADTTATEDGVRVAFHIEEGRPVLVSDITVDGLDVPGATDITRNLPLRKDDRFVIQRYDADRDTITARLKNRGYPRAEVLAGYDISNAEPYVVSVRYNVMPGTRARFGPVDVVGNQSISGNVVRRMLSFRSGDLYDQADILASQRNLFELQVFRHVDIQPDLNAAPDSVVPVTVQVNEGAMRNVRVGAGMNQAECLTAEGRWQSQNFLGGARQLQVRGRISNVLAKQMHGSFLCKEVGDTVFRDLGGLFTVDFVQPFFFGPANNVGAGLIAERRSVPNIFVRRAIGGYVSLTRRLGRSAFISLAYRPESTRLEGAVPVVLCTSFIGCTPNELDVLTRSNWLSPVTLSYVADRGNDVFSPTRGHVFRTDLEYASSYTASKFAYVRWNNDASLYHYLGGASVLALHLRAGLAWSLKSGESGLNPQKRFFAGGANSVRGFGQYQLGPEVLTVKNAARDLLVDTLSNGWPGCTPFSINNGSCNISRAPSNLFQAQPKGGGAVLEGSIELRLPSPIWRDKLRTALFVDAGQVWPSPGEIELKGNKGIIATPGFGFRYESPVGPIRLDIAYNTQGPRNLDVWTQTVCEIQEGSTSCPPLGNQKTGYRNTGLLVPMGHNVAWSPYSRPADTLPGFLQRLRIHFSIGQAF